MAGMILTVTSVSWLAVGIGAGFMWLGMALTVTGVSWLAVDIGAGFMWLVWPSLLLVFPC